MKRKILIYLTLLILFISSVFLASCDKENQLLADKNDSSSQTTVPVKSAAYCSAIFLAKAYSDIPIRSYRLATIYRDSYKHLKQPDYTSCSWTAYVIAAGTMANTYSCVYDVSTNKVYSVKAACSNNSLITSLQSYADVYDKNYFSVTRPNIGTNQFNAVKYMIGFIDTYHTPFLAISSMSGIGHYRIVHTIEWYGSITNSYVYFTDPAVVAYTSFDSNIRSMRLDEFLNSMLATTSVYNMLFFIPKWLFAIKILEVGSTSSPYFFLETLMYLNDYLWSKK